jgi:hypothetical protein
MTNNYHTIQANGTRIIRSIFVKGHSISLVYDPQDKEYPYRVTQGGYTKKRYTSWDGATLYFNCLIVELNKDTSRYDSYELTPYR